MSAIDQEPFPKPVLIGAAVVITATIALAAVGRMENLAHPRPVLPATAPTVVRELRFDDGANGSVRVTDARTGALVSLIPPGKGGFVRGVMRSLARERRIDGDGRGPPFRLSRLPSGNLWLQDEADGRVIDLDSFGDTNRAAFAVFLPGGEGGR